MESFSQNLVSTIIPLYNRPKLIEEAVNSVLEQTYRPIEIIIINDGSTDESGAIAEKLAKQYPKQIKVLHQENAGPGAAREKGRQKAQGEYIQYLDSDDRLLSRKFELQVAGLTNHPKCGISYCKTRFYKYGDIPKDIAWKRTGERIEAMFPAFLKSRWWGTSTPLYRRKVIDKVGPWTTLRNEEDWEYDCRIATHNVLLHYVPEFLSEQRDHDGSRLSRGGSVEKTKLRDRKIAHMLIYKHAEKAGITQDYPEMQYFARELFLLSRMCGSAGLARESKELFRLARKASGHERGNGMDFRLYGLLSRIFGWALLGRLTCFSDKFRRKNVLY
jgi:glycosyltransferase involved in cell wall biosynthesis